MKDLFGFEVNPPIIKGKIVKGKKVNPMLVMGNGPEDKKCKHCIHFCVNQPGANKYFKCRLRGITNGTGTDHRANWPTCIKFEEEEP